MCAPVPPPKPHPTNQPTNQPPNPTVDRYRFWHELWNQNSTVVFVDDQTYAFRRGLVVVVTTNGNWSAANPRPAAYTLRGMPEGLELCDQLNQQVGEACLHFRTHLR